MGSWFSCDCQSIFNYNLTTKTLDSSTGSSFCGVYYSHGPMPYGVKVVRNATEQDEDEDQVTNFDCYCCATTTAFTLLKRGEHLMTTQIGNSGAILVTRDKNNVLIPVHLTANPRKCRVEPKVDKGPPKLSAPLISHRRITDADVFVVLATGGVWEVLRKKEVVNIVATCPGRRGAAQAVVDAVIRKWMYNYPTSMLDDCAVVCLFLNSSTRHPSPQPHVVTTNKINNILPHVVTTNKINNILPHVGTTNKINNINILPVGKKKKD